MAQRQRWGRQEMPAVPGVVTIHTGAGSAAFPPFPAFRSSLPGSGLARTPRRQELIPPAAPVKASLSGCVGGVIFQQPQALVRAGSWRRGRRTGPPAQPQKRG